MNSEKIKAWLTTLGVINDDQKMSITNVIVFVFTGIVAFKLLFTGLDMSNKFFDWKVQPIDVNATLPMLFALINYGHKRSVLNAAQSSEKEEA